MSWPGRETATSVTVANGPGALSGLKIIDLSTVAAGPFCTQILGDHGAEVIKVEPPFGEVGRRMGPSFNQDGFSSYYFGLNRNKRAIALDLAQPAGVEVMHRLLAEADVLVNNFKPGTLEKFGLGYQEVLRARHPRLIVANITGFGAVGPLGGLPGLDPVGQAMSGLMSYQGEPDGRPLRASSPVADLSTGLYLTIGILMALQERHRSGMGQEIECTLLDSALTLVHPYASEFFMSGAEPRRLGNRNPTTAPQNVYPCADGFIILCCSNDGQFRNLCQVLGAPEMWEDERYRTLARRFANQDDVDARIIDFCAARGKQEAAMLFLKRGIPAAPVLGFAEAMTQPHLAARGLTYSEPTTGYRMLGTPVKLGRTPGMLRRTPPRFGEHNREVLRGVGFTEPEIDSLINGSVIFETPRES